MNWYDEHLGKAQVVLADPCWYYADRKKGKTVGGACNQYALMKTPEIAALNIQRLCADDCVMYMWATCPHFESMLTVMKAWGFKFVTKGFTWIKNNEGGGLFAGPGNYTASNSEDVWIGRRGKFLKPETRLVPQVILQPRTKHSRKPDAVHDRLDKMYSKLNRVELFARHKRENWACLGLELGHDFKEL